MADYLQLEEAGYLLEIEGRADHWQVGDGNYQLEVEPKS